MQEALDEKKTEEETTKVKKIIDQKIASSPNGMIYLNNTDMKIIIEWIFTQK